MWANELARFAAVRSDTRGALEAEAYAAWMGANLLLEKESDWEVALAKFTRAKWVWAVWVSMGCERSGWGQGTGGRLGVSEA